MTWEVYKKEMKDSIRDQKTLFLSVFIPMLFSIGLIFFMEKIFFGDTEEILPVAVDANIDEAVQEWISDTEGIKVIVTEDPVQQVYDGKAVAAVQASKDFMDELENFNSPEIKILSDPSSKRGDSASTLLSWQLETKLQELISIRLMENNIEPSLIQPFILQVEDISEDDSMSLYMLSFFAQLIIILTVVMGGIPSANDLFAGEKERKTMEALLMTPVKRIHIITGKWLTIATLGAASGIVSVIAFVLSIHLFAENLSQALKISDNLLTFTFSIIVGIIFFALLIASIQMIVSLLANNLKEASNYISPISMLSMLPYFILISISANELTDVHFMIPFFNIYALIKQLIYGIYDIKSVLLVAGSSLVVIVIIFLIALGMFRKSKWVLGK